MTKPMYLGVLAVAVAAIALGGCSGGEPDVSSEDQQKAAATPDTNLAPGQPEAQEKAF